MIAREAALPVPAGLIIIAPVFYFSGDLHAFP